VIPERIIFVSRGITLFINFKKEYDSVRRKVLYNILIQISIPVKLVTLIKMCLMETYRRVRVGRHLCDVFHIMNGLKQGDALSPLLFNFASEYGIKRFQVKQDGFKLNGTHNLLVCLMMFIYRAQTYILLRQKRSFNSC